MGYVHGYIFVCFYCVFYSCFLIILSRNQAQVPLTLITLSHLASLGKTFPHSFNLWHKRVWLQMFDYSAPFSSFFFFNVGLRVFVSTDLIA